ncbi:MAG: hydrogenase nickel incorporation protein HypB [Nanoarchaeota archaeon]
MCNECGCDEKLENSIENNKFDIKEESNNNNEIKIEKNILDENDLIADKINHEFIHKEILCVNILGSPGSGKTTFIENISKYLGSDKIFVIQGDLESDVDKIRLEKQNIKTFQINTHSGCHLNSEMIFDALKKINLEGINYLFIENIGNLVCPANIKLGQEIDIIISSTTEGSDKPKKYPIIFNNADAILISKMDLAKHVAFNKQEYVSDLKQINNKGEIFYVSSKKEDSFRKVADFFKKNLDKLKEKSKKHNH